MVVEQNSKSSSKAGIAIVIALVLGVVLGQLAHLEITNPETVQTICGYLDIVSGIFLRLIKMIIAPLVFTTLVAGIAKMGDGKSLGRVFLKSMIIFMVGGVLSLGLGVLLVEIFEPGKALHEVLKSSLNADTNAAASSAIQGTQMSLKSFIESIIPKSSFEGFVENHIIQVVVLAMFVGVAGVSLGERVAPVFAFFEMISLICFKIIQYIMLLAPLAVFASVTKLVMSSGIGVLKLYIIYLLEFYLGLGIIWAVYILLGTIFLGKVVFKVIKDLAPQYATSFAASSSEIILADLMRKLEKFGVSKKISGFVIPLGYSFNLEASMLNCTFATIFIIQLYGYHIDLVTEITMLLMLLFTSKGMAGVPRASLVIVAMTLTAFGYPEAGILIILPIDSFNDMGRSVTNAFANTMSALFVNRWEKNHLNPDDVNSETEA